MKIFRLFEFFGVLGGDPAFFAGLVANFVPAFLFIQKAKHLTRIDFGSLGSGEGRFNTNPEPASGSVFYLDIGLGWRRGRGG